MQIWDNYVHIYASYELTAMNNVMRVLSKDDSDNDSTNKDAAMAQLH